MLKLWQLWMLILGFLRPGIEGEKDNAGDGAEGESNEEGAEGDGAEGEGGTGEEEPPPQKVSRGNQAIIDARKRAQDAEAAAARTQGELDAMRRSSQGQLTPDQERFQQEEAKLRDPKTTPLERWQIDSNRAIRQTKNESARALAQAADMQDRTSFDIACSQNKRMASIKAEVDQELTRMRASGQNAPRESLAYFLLGKKVANAPAAKPAANAGVDRGKSPGARSDVNLKGRTSERDKRAKRLDGVQI